MGGGNSQNRRVFRRAVERTVQRLLEKRDFSLSDSDNRSAKVFFWIGLAAIAILSSLPLIGVTVNVYFGGFVLLVGFGLLIRAFWVWALQLRLHTALKIGTIATFALFYFAFSGEQMLREYRKEHLAPQVVRKSYDLGEDRRAQFLTMLCQPQTEPRDTLRIA
jgi:hypothetical protein